MQNLDCKTICEYELLLHVKVFGSSGLIPVIKKDVVRVFSSDVSKRPRIIFDDCLRNKKDENYSDKYIYRPAGGNEISQKDFKSFISLQGIKKRECVAPAGNTYTEYYFED